MRILVDSSGWISFFQLDDVHRGRAEHLINSFLRNGDQIILPGIVLVEVLNTIWRLTRDKDVVFKCHLALISNDELIKRHIGSESFG